MVLSSKITPTPLPPTWRIAAAGVRALAIRGFEPRIFRRPKCRRPKGLYLLGLAATRAAARLSPFGVRAAALVRDNVFKVEYPKKLNFRQIYTFRSHFSMKHTGQRFEGRVSQKVKLSHDFHFPVTFFHETYGTTF